MFEKIVTTIVVGYLTYFLGLFGWTQIVGSIQKWKVRGAKASMMTITLWTVIFAAVTLVIVKWLPDYRWPYKIGMGIALILILGAGEIE